MHISIPHDVVRSYTISTITTQSASCSFCMHNLSLGCVICSLCICRASGARKGWLVKRWHVNETLRLINCQNIAQEFPLDLTAMIINVSLHLLCLMMFTSLSATSLIPTEKCKCFDMVGDIGSCSCFKSVLHALPESYLRIFTFDIYQPPFDD